RDGRTRWPGGRNYQARNFLRDDARPGDRVLFYHSNVQPPGVVGVAEVASEPYPDPAQFDPTSRYHDPKATEEEPRWYVVDVIPRRRLPRTVTLAELKADPALAELQVVRRGNRLSVMPVGDAEADHILALAERPAPDAD
ncbi:MAG: EVE domain-containing protein, partial [Trueperaceae bacterium]